MKRARAVVDLAAEAEQLAAAVEASGSVRAQRLRALRLDAAEHARLVERLAQRGVEWTGKNLRRPLDAQLAALLERERVVPLKTLRRALAGVSDAAEVAALTKRTLNAGRARLVIRDGLDHLAHPDVAALDAASERALDAELARLSKGLRARRKKGPHPRALLASEVPPFDVEQWLLVVIAAAGTPLVYVPELARLTRAACPLERLHAALLGSARLELRPESGVGGPPEDDVALCPRGAGGVVLTYVRLREPR